MVGSSEKLKRLAAHAEDVKRELVITKQYQPAGKDILIVTHNQLDYLKQCVESVRLHTQDYQLYVWDNASDRETQDWLGEQSDIIVTRSETNEGFIIPNNRLVKQGHNPYIILLNNDTVVLPDWDKAMIAFIQQTGAAQVGYVGGWINEEGKGALFGWGSGVHYIPGWCFTIPRAVYDEYGLFDEENYSFAYCEDADFSFRLTEAGRQIHALHLDLVFHYENTTIKTVHQLRDCRTSFVANHAFLKGRWKHRFAVSPCA